MVKPSILFAVAVAAMMLATILSGCTETTKKSEPIKEETKDEYVNHINFTDEFPVYQWLIEPCDGGEFNITTHEAAQPDGEHTISGIMWWVGYSKPISTIITAGEWACAFGMGCGSRTKVSVLNYTLIDQITMIPFGLTWSCGAPMNGTTFLMLCVTEGVKYRGTMNFSKPVKILRSGPDPDGKVYAYDVADFDSDLTIINDFNMMTINGKKKVHVSNRLFGVSSTHTKYAYRYWCESPYGNTSKEFTYKEEWMTFANEGPGDWNFYMDGTVDVYIVMADTNVEVPWDADSKLTWEYYDQYE